MVGSLGSLAEWRRVRILYSAFLLAAVELDSSGALEWIVERIEGSIPQFSGSVVVSYWVLHV